jgi:N-terminal domain of anti-restriction factor ArdC
MSATARKSYSKRFTDEERAAYKQAQRDEAQRHLESAVESLQSEAGFAAWLRARARFHNYSANNVMLILAQLPEATRVAAASVWRELGRYPAKGSHALRVFAPMEWWVACDADELGARYNAKKKRHERKVRTFKLVPVFDVSQTDGDELPEAPEPVALDGDSHAHLEPALVTLARELGYSVSTEQLDDGVGGYCDSSDAKRIVVAEGHSPNARVRVLVHELAHALGIGYRDYGREAAETIVEAATFIVLAGQGFDVSAASVPYVAGWSGENGVDKLRTFAETIDTVARRIESAL